MSVLNVMNSLNGGRGLRMLTMEGYAAWKKAEREEKKRRGIHWNKNVDGEPWADELQQKFFAPEYEGKYWGYAKVVR